MHLFLYGTLQTNNQKKNIRCSNSEAQEPESKELISALAAGMNAKLMVEVTSEVSSSTVALAAAARQTGGKVVCIVPELKVNESMQAIEDSGLEDRVEFKTGDPVDVLPRYEKIDFSVVDCKMDDNRKLLDTLDVNPRSSVVVANNLVEGKKGVEGHLKAVEKKANVRSIKHNIGNGMEITMIGKSSDGCKRNRHPRSERKKSLKTDRSNWIATVDKKSGEEHIYRIPKTYSL